MKKETNANFFQDSIKLRFYQVSAMYYNKFRSKWKGIIVVLIITVFLYWFILDITQKDELG